MTAPADDLRGEVVAYYERKLHAHGTTPAGVDWNSHDSQERRFLELCRVIEPGQSVLDVGCGYGALLDHLRRSGWAGDYVGFDLSNDMVAAARRLHPHDSFVTTMPPERSADVVIGSGLFNVKMGFATEEWQDYVRQTVLTMFSRCTVAVAFNVLTSVCDRDRMREDLYYASPSEWFDFITTQCSRRVTLLHDYGLHEFTMLVRR
jgi:SAM-dependent methyltransferase